MPSKDPWPQFRAQEREKMVIEQIRARGIQDSRVLAAMAKVPRHLFVSDDYSDVAYEDRPVPISCNQTISQPYMVAAMTELLALNPGDRVLEIGTGSGYQTAILAELSAYVYTIERLSLLLDTAKRRLSGMEFTKIQYILGDGTLGCQEYAPFDAIMITAGCPDIPYPLLKQLCEGGRLVAPVGDRELQTLVHVFRKGDHFRRTPQFHCRFVPLIGDHGWSGEESPV